MLTPLQVDPSTITVAGSTGETGAGKVFVVPVESAQQNRTGKEGLEAV